jgi:glycogen synthase
VRILLCSHVFSPSIGGIETVSSLLAEAFWKAGLMVTVVTGTPGVSTEDRYRVVRQPTLRVLRSLGERSDIIFQNNISLQTLLPLLPLRKPVVITHQTWLTRVNGRRGWQDYIKLAILPLCHNVAISKAVANALPVKSLLINNPFDVCEFGGMSESLKTKDIVFLGRLVSDKGCDLLLHALAELRTDGLFPSLTVIGDGSEMGSLKALTAKLGLSAQVEFRGALREGRGEELARHRILVVPSKWAEPFGLVALEGIAAGCALVASSQGGLAEAVGPCGLLFPNGDVTAMASALKTLLPSRSLCENLASSGPDHLRRFQPASVAEDYSKLFRSLVSAA